MSITECWQNLFVVQCHYFSELFGIYLKKNYSRLYYVPVSVVNTWEKAKISKMFPLPARQLQGG